MGILAYAVIIAVVNWLVRQMVGDRLPLPGFPGLAKKLFTHTLDSEMKVLAAEAVTRAKEEYRVQLTYDRSGVKDLESRILGDLHANHVIESTPVETLAAESRMWGAYLGEVLRRIRAGHWRKQSRRSDRPMPFDFGPGEVFPCDWILRRIKHGERFDLAAAVEDYVRNRDRADYSGFDDEP